MVLPPPPKSQSCPAVPERVMSSTAKHYEHSLCRLASKKRTSFITNGCTQYLQSLADKKLPDIMATTLLAIIILCPQLTSGVS